MSNSLDYQRKIKTGKWLSTLIATMTLITWGFAMIAVPPCGPYCLENCINYPYLDTLNQFPRDFIWVYLALFQIIIFLVFISFIHQSAREERKMFSLPGLLIGTIASGILLMTYYVQAAVLPISLVKEEYDGLALFTMYNEHGIFIAREEIAYLLMALSLFLLSWVFTGSDRRTVFLKWLFRLPFLASLLAFAVITALHGMDRSYRFEIVTISANWLVLIVGGYSMIGWYKSLSSNNSEKA